MCEETVLSAQHDVQRFVVDHFVDWSINTDDGVDLLVHWKCHPDENERTWEALEQLVVDVPALVKKFVLGDGHHQLVGAYRKALADAKRQSKK